MYFSQWNENKGIFVLLEAVKHLEATRNDFQVLLAGSSTLYARTVWGRLAEEIAEERRIHQEIGRLRTVEVVGAVEYKDLPAFLANADIATVPTVQWETFGLVNAEAMASGLPVVASRVGGIPEVVADGETGLLVPPGDPQALANAIARLIDDLPLRRRMADAARRRVVDQFSLDRHIDGLCAVFERVMRLQEESRGKKLAAGSGQSAGG